MVVSLVSQVLSSHLCLTLKVIVPTLLVTAYVAILRWSSHNSDVLDGVRFLKSYDIAVDVLVRYAA